MKTGLLQQQITKLALTKELRQSITLLQYTSYELTHYLTDLSLENPFVKLKEKVYKSPNKLYEKEIAASDQPTLEQHIKSQLDDQSIEFGLRNSIYFLLSMMDENGYIREDLHQLSEQYGYHENDLQKALEYIQQHLEPAGLGAQSLQQSLYLQLQRKYPTSIIAHKLVEQYFVQLAEKKWEMICKELGISIEDIQRAFALIQTLNPRPGGDFKPIDIPYVVPDLYIEKGEEGYFVTNNERAHISFTIDEEYLTMRKEVIDQESLDFLKAKYNEAKSIMNSIEQRKRTMVLVTQAILIRQNKFFDYGLSFLQPLTLKEIADELDLHESTISRTVRGKYVQTPIGVYELKFFFHSKVKSTYDKDISSIRVKELIKQMVMNEEKQKPLSDQKIADRLKDDHKLNVSRRTVAKYRDQLRIPSSSSRKIY